MSAFVRSLAAFFLLPYLVAGQIQVEVIPGGNDRNPNVVVAGSESAKARDVDLDMFKLTIDGVKSNLQRLGWVSVGDVNLNHASAYGFKDLRVTLKPTLGRILRVNDRLVKGRKRTFRNENDKPRTIAPEFEAEFPETMTTKWHDIRDIAVGGNIKHIVGFNRVEHDSRYGHEDFASRSMLIEATSDDEVHIKPNKYVRAGLEVKETTMSVKVEYEFGLDGDIYFGFLCTPIFKVCAKHTSLDIKEYFKMLDIPPSIKSYEIVTFTYHHDAKVVVGEPMDLADKK